MKAINFLRHISFILTSVLLFFLLSCEERININTSASSPQLVIYGYITTDTTQQAIRITRSTGYFDTSAPSGISHAVVSISCDNDVFPLTEAPDEPGLYLTSPDVYGLPGKTYTLHAQVDFDGDGNMEDYEATSYLPFPATLDSTEVTQSPTVFSDHHLQVEVWGKLPEESSGNFSFHLFRNGTVVNDSLSGFNIIQDDHFATKTFASLPIFQLDQEDDTEKISVGDTLVVQVESLTSEYATFIQDAQTELRGSIPLFGGPPANVKTNIQCLNANYKTGISGFFTAYSKNRTSIVYAGL